MRSRDTDAAAHAAQMAALRRLGPAGRMRIAVEMSETARQLAIDGLRRRRPELSEREAMMILLRASSATPR